MKGLKDIRFVFIVAVLVVGMACQQTADPAASPPSPTADAIPRSDGSSARTDSFSYTHPNSDSNADSPRTARRVRGDPRRRRPRQVPEVFPSEFQDALNHVARWP